MDAATTPWMRTLAVFCARVVLGLIFGMAGWHKVFVMTPAGHAAEYFTVPYAESWIPYWLLYAAGVTVPFIELAGGWLLVAGWRIRDAMIALGLVLILVTYGHLLASFLFNFSGHVIPRLALLAFVSWVPREVDWLSVDGWLARRRLAHHARAEQRVV
jgi:thiosulfate dehydrogenase (quinone) large subunit